MSDAARKPVSHVPARVPAAIAGSPVGEPLPHDGGVRRRHGVGACGLMGRVRAHGDLTETIVNRNGRPVLSAEATANLFETTFVRAARPSFSSGGPMDRSHCRAFSPKGPLGLPRGPLVSSIGPHGRSSGPVGSQSGPSVASSGPLGTSRGPLESRNGPVSSPSEPLVASTGPLWFRTGRLVVRTVLWIFKRAFRSRGRPVDRSKAACLLAETPLRLVDRTGERDRTSDERAHRTSRLDRRPARRPRTHVRRARRHFRRAKRTSGRDRQTASRPERASLAQRGPMSGSKDPFSFPEARHGTRKEGSRTRKVRLSSKKVVHPSRKRNCHDHVQTRQAMALRRCRRDCGGGVHCPIGADARLAGTIAGALSAPGPRTS